MPAQKLPDPAGGLAPAGSKKFLHKLAGKQTFAVSHSGDIDVVKQFLRINKPTTNYRSQSIVLDVIRTFVLIEKELQPI